MVQVVNVISARQLGNYEAFLAPLWVTVPNGERIFLRYKTRNFS